MEHTPYGYRIEHGRAVVDDETAGKVRQMYRFYLEGAALTTSAKKAGIPLFHGGAARMLSNQHYLGDAYYPAIIDKETFERAKEERRRRAKSLGRVREPQEQKTISVPHSFHMKEAKAELDDPFRLAEYQYSLIESEG